jgi:hypothetical protein
MNSAWIETKRRKVKVERVVGWFDVWTGDLPFAKFTLKVVENVEGGFTASPNVFIKSKDGIEYTCGVGESSTEAVTDAINAFYQEIENIAPLNEITEDAFVWLCWTPFGSEPFKLDKMKDS